MDDFPSVASLCEAAGNRGALPPRLRPVTRARKLRGPAFPVSTPPGQNYWVHYALALAPSGSVLVVDAGGDPTAGYWGRLMTVAAQRRGLAGLVIDGAVRDGSDLEESGFPIFACGLAPRGTGKDRARGGTAGEPIAIGGTVVTAGDLVRGDRDGVVIVPGRAVQEVLEAARQRELRETEIARRAAQVPLHQLLGLDVW